jgi:hypothetical protein
MDIREFHTLSAGLTPIQSQVLLSLLILSEDGERVAFSKQELAQHARIDRGRTLPRALEELQDLGFLTHLDGRDWAITRPMENSTVEESTGVEKSTVENSTGVEISTVEDSTGVGFSTGGELHTAPSVARSKDTYKGTSTNGEGTPVYTGYPAEDLEGTRDEKEPDEYLVSPSRPFVTQEPSTNPEGTPEDAVEYWVHPGPDGLPVTMEEWLRVQEVYRLWKAEDTYYLEHGGSEPATLWQTFKASNLDRWRSYRDIRNCREGRAPARVDPPEPGRTYPWAGQERALYAKWERSGGRESWEDWRDRLLMEDFALVPDNDINQFLWTTTLENRRRLLRGT